MPVRTDEEVREALEAQADDNQHAGELLDILRWSPAGNAAQKRARLLSFLAPEVVQPSQSGDWKGTKQMGLGGWELHLFNLVSPIRRS